MSKKVKSKKSKPLRPFSRIKVLGEGIDEFGNLFIKFSVVGSDRDIPPFSAKQLTSDPKPLFEELANAGCYVFTSKVRSGFLEKLQNRKPQPPTFKVVTRLGWNSGAFVLPNEVLGHTNKQLECSFRHIDYQMRTKYRCRGKLKDWKDNVGALCKGNSRLMFAAALACTGPILRFVTGPRSGGFQISGKGETGKTTAAMVAGSFWGCHRLPEHKEKGFAESWHTTAGKVEITALAHNETLLILDETKRAGRTDVKRAQAVIDISFNLAENTERERLNNQGPVRAWRLYFLSTSNYTLRQLAQRANLDVDEAELGRLADIPLPANSNGIYEDLHGYPNGVELTDELKVRCRKFFGTPSREFVRKLVAEHAKDPKALKKFLRERQAYYLKLSNAKTEAEGLRPLNRVAGRFATVYAAGCLAIRYGILPWSRHALAKAILSCQLDGLRHAAEDDLNADPVVALRSKLVKHLDNHHAKFMNLKTKHPKLGRDKLDAVRGYRAKFRRKRWYYLTADQLKAIIGVGRNAGALKRQLADERLLDKTSDGRFVVDRPIFTGGKGKENWARVHAIKAAICRTGKADG
jgi:putative DNA primase/helicase